MGLPGAYAGLAEPATAGSTEWFRKRLSDRLQPEKLGGSHPLPVRLPGADLQQLDRETKPAHRARSQELVICRKSAHRQTHRRDHEHDPVGQTQWP